MDNVELTDQEWNSRKLSKAGYISAMLDLLLLALYFSGAGLIGVHIVPGVNDPGQLFFWWILTLILVVCGLKITLKILDVRTEYQTIILRKPKGEPEVSAKN